jgi:hypothetical protein
MKFALAVLALLLAAPAMAQPVQKDCTFTCKLFADPTPEMTVGVDKCQLWNGATKLVENLYAGGTVTTSAGVVTPAGCVFDLTIADGVTVYMQANHWRMKDNFVSPSGNILELKSVKPLSPVPAPLNLRIAEELRAIANKIAAGKPLE